MPTPRKLQAESLPCCELLAAHKLILAGDYITADVTTSGDDAAHRHGIRAPRAKWREFAHRLLAACEAAEVRAALDAPGAPITKPSGYLL